VGPAGSLQAYDATNLKLNLYDSSATNGRDTLPQAVKFTTPTVVNGKVYVGTSSSVGVFGLGHWPGAPSVSLESGRYLDSVTFTASCSTPGAIMTYTIDGTEPTASSTRYRGPVTLNASATVCLRAFKEGYGPSALTVADYLVNPIIGHGTGLLAHYSPEAGSASRVDPKIDFNWSGDTAQTYWSARWTGFLQAEASGWHTISVSSDDSVQVRIHGELIVDSTAYSDEPKKAGRIYLTAGVKAPIEIQYSHNGVDAALQLCWSGPGLPQELIPTSQLYAR
jgi:hypothetical protein